MALKDIEEFLAREVHEGQFDSSGSFSLDESRSLDKLARYQSERPGLWLVKLLQAATALGCQEFVVKQESGRTVVRFRARLAVDWTPWRQGNASSQSGLRHLQIGLQAASTLSDCRFTLQAGATLPWQVERGALRLPLDPPEIPLIEVVRHWTSFSFSPIEHVRRARSQRDEFLLLQELCRYAPLTVWLDRRLLNDPVINKPPGLRLGVYLPPFASRPRPAIPYTSVERIVTTHEPLHTRMALMDHTLRVPQFLQRNREMETRNGKHLFLQQWTGTAPLNQVAWCGLLRNDGPGFQFDSRIERSDGEFEIWSDYNRELGSLAVRGYLSLDINRKRPGRLYLVRDGVLMKPKLLPPELEEVLIIWSAPHLNTDLTQLQIIEDELYAAEYHLILQHLSEAAAALAQMFKQRGPRTAEEFTSDRRARRVLSYLEKREAPKA